MSKWALIGIAAVASALPLPLLKSCLTTNNYYYIFLALMSNFMVILTYYIMLQNQKMNIMYPFVKILSIIMVIFVGVFFYEEQLILEHKIGIMFGLASLYLLSQ